MVDLVLRPAEQAALATLVAAEPVPGDPIPPPEALEALLTLVPADALETVLADDRGRIVADRIDLPLWMRSPGDDCVGGCGPLYVGLTHWPEHPAEAAACQTLPGVDAIAIGFRVGAEHVAQERPTPHLPASITVQERRVLMHVATGASNAEIARALFIAPSTVRKHLEHIYAKLGVHNRLQALAVLRGSDIPDLDLRERVARYA